MTELLLGILFGSILIFAVIDKIYNALSNLKRNKLRLRYFEKMKDFLKAHKINVFKISEGDVL